MRILIDTLIAFMLIALIAGVLYYQHLDTVQEQDYQAIHSALTELNNLTCFHAAIGDVECNDRGYAKTIYKSWFSDSLPRNHLADVDQPWIDFAPSGDYSDHPPDPVIRSSDQAGFWYNPNRGVFRARVLDRSNDQETLKIYNYVNQAALQFLPFDYSMARSPLPLPAELASTQHASLSTGTFDQLTEDVNTASNDHACDNHGSSDTAKADVAVVKQRPTLVSTQLD